MTMQEYSWHVFIVPIVAVGAILLWTGLYALRVIGTRIMRRQDRQNAAYLLEKRQRLIKDWAEDIDG